MPNLPTDNLYKFMALSGVFLLSFFIYTGISMFDRLQEQILANQLMKNEVDSRLEWADSESKLVQFALDKIEKNEIIDQEQLKKLADTNRENGKDLKEIMLDISKLKLLEEKRRLMQTQFDFLKNLFVFCIIISTVISMVGFALWYCRVQKYLDVTIKKEAKI